MNIVKDIIETFDHSMVVELQCYDVGFIEHIDNGFPVIVSYYSHSVLFAAAEQHRPGIKEPYCQIWFNDLSIDFNPYMYGEDYRRLTVDEIKTLRDMILMELM